VIPALDALKFPPDTTGITIGRAIAGIAPATLRVGRIAFATAQDISAQVNIERAASFLAQSVCNRANIQKTAPELLKTALPRRREEFLKIIQNCAKA
jgi:hypothetical protein